MTFRFYAHVAVLGFATLALVGPDLTAQTPTGNTSINAEISPAKLLAIRLIGAKSDLERSALLDSIKETDQSDVARAVLDQADEQNGKAPPAEIERIARIGSRVAALASDKRAAARAWLIIGNSQSDDTERFESYKKGLEAARAAPADDLIVKLVIRIGQLQMGTKDEEIEWYRSGLESAQRLADKSIFPSLLGRIGNAYAQNGQYETAREYHARSLELKRAMNDDFGIATTMSNLGIIYGMQGDSVAARKHFEQSIAMLDKLGAKDNPDLARRKANDLRNLGIVAADSWHALEYYLQSLKLSEDLKYDNGIYGTSFQIATLYNGQGNYELARQFLRRGAGVTDDNQIPTEMMGVLGDSYMGEGKYEQALNAYLEQNEDVMKHEGGDNIVDSLMHLGEVYLTLHNVKQANAYFDRALQKAKETKNELKIFRALEGLSRSRLADDDPKAAIDLAEQAKAHQARLTGAQESAEIYTTIGSAYERLGRSDLARSNFDKAIGLIEKQRTQILDSDGRGMLQRTIIPFHRSIELSTATNDLEAAFSYAERAKARTLLDVLTQGKVNITGTMTAEEKAAEQRLKNETVSLSAQLASEKEAKVPRRDLLDSLERQLNEKRLDVESFRDRLYAAHPELRTQRGEMKPVRLEDAATVQRGNAIIEYAVTKNRTFLFAIGTDRSLKVFTVNIKQEDLTDRIEAFRSKLANGELDFAAAASGLYDLLVKPAAGQLRNTTSIIIVPDGPLWNLPFQALQTATGKFLIEQAAISYSPSVTALGEMQKRNGGRKTSGASLVAFGNPTVNEQTSDRLKTVFMDEKLEPLPEAERLVNTLAKMYGPQRSKVYTGAAAREETAKSEAPKYRIVQFATHGILNDVSPMYSHLVLAQDEKDPNEDGLLEAWELKDLDLKADMVILSACDTARGKISSGEGIIGMTWAAFIAGAPTTVASQWKVESSSTTELMLEFHRQLLAGKVSKAEALRRAQLKLMRNPKYKHPSYWAAWVLVGDGS